MKQPHLLLPLAGLSLLGALQASAQTTLTIDGLQVRSNATFGNAFATSPPTADLTATAPSNNVDSSTSSTVTWSNLDLDGIGGTDDSITFDLVGTSLVPVEKQVTWGGLGWGAEGSFDGAETLLFTVENLSIGGSAAGGTLTFSGFTKAGFLVTAGDLVAVDVTGQINDVEVVASTAAEAGTQFPVFESADFALTPSVKFDDFETVSGGGNSARTLDLEFVYDPTPSTPPPAPQSFVANDMDLRKDATFVRFGNFSGGVNTGSIVAQPGFDPTAVANDPTTDLLLRWEGLNLDDVGVDDDYFDFTLRLSGGSDDVAWASPGSAVDPPTFGLDPGEELSFEVVNVQVNPGIPGSVTFDGFSDAGFYVAVTYPAVPTVASSMGADLNGNSVLGEVQFGDGGFESIIVRDPFPLAQTLVVNNITETIGDANPNSWIRSYDLQFTYDATVAPAPTSLSSSNTSVRPNDVFPLPDPGVTNGGNASIGDIVPWPDNASFIGAAGPTTDLSLRWQNIDLDNDGVTDDYFDFKVRYTNLLPNGENINTGGNQGIGVNGNGSGELNDGDEVQVEIVDIVPSPGLSGSVTFDGFTQAALGSGVGGDGGNVSVDCDINGIPVGISFGNDPGFQYTTASASFPLTPTVVFDNVVQVADLKTPSARIREFSLNFTYDPSGTAPSGPISVESVTFASPDLTITTIGVVDGTTYHVEYSPDLSTPFIPLAGSDEVAASGSVVHVIDVGSDTEGFYRVVEGAAPAL